MTSVTGYTVTSYGDMVARGPRMQAYARALEATVRPGCTVIDLGAGPGILGLLACRLGAGHVHAIEPNASIEVARMLARANGFSDRFTFHKEISTAVTLATRADVIVSDLRGILPTLQSHFPSIADARARLLAPGGQLIGKRDVVRGALVGNAEIYRSCAHPWDANDYGLDLSAGKTFVVNAYKKVSLRSADLLVPPQDVFTIDYETVTDPNVGGRMTWTIDTPGTAYGLALWFDACLHEDAGFTNAPGSPELVYGQAFYPLQQPVALATGESVTLSVRGDLVANDYVWSWRTEVLPPRGEGPPRVRFDQSTFHAAPLAPRQLRKRAAAHVPTLSPAGQADLYLLSRMDGHADLDAIARDALARFPRHFANFGLALARAGELSDRYGS